jgi:hypothetical protein
LASSNYRKEVLQFGGALSGVRLRVFGTPAGWQKDWLRVAGHFPVTLFSILRLRCELAALASLAEASVISDLTLVFGWGLLDVVDHDHIDRHLLSNQPETELLL